MGGGMLNAIILVSIRRRQMVIWTHTQRRWCAGREERKLKMLNLKITVTQPQAKECEQPPEARTWFLPRTSSRGAQPSFHRLWMDMKAAQHKIINLFKTFFFCSSVFVSVCVFNVWSRITLLLPVWSRDAKRLDTSAKRECGSGDTLLLPIKSDFRLLASRTVIEWISVVLSH